MFSGSRASRGTALIVNQIGGRDDATGAVTYQARLTGRRTRGLTLSFTPPHNGLVTDLGDGMFRYTPVPQVNPRSDSFTVTARDGRGRIFDSPVTWINDNHHPTTRVSPNIVEPERDSLGPPMRGPDPVTGVVTGGGWDAPAGTRYTVGSATNGAVIINPATGSWAYRPTAAARHRAVADDASPGARRDTFAITVTDCRGESVVMPVTVPLVVMKTVPSYSVTATIPVGIAPVDMAISPAGDRVYVTNVVDDAGVTVIRTADNTTTAIALDFSPEGMAVGPDGQHIYVADPVGNRVAVIDPAEGSAVYVPVGERPFRMALLGTDLYVANNQDGTVSVIDTETNAVVRTIVVDGHPYAIAARDRYVYVTDYGFYGGQSSHSVSVIDAEGAHVIDEIPVGYYPTDVTVSPDGRRVYVTNDEGAYTRSHPGTTTVIDAATLDVVDTLAVGGVSITVDASRAYVVSHANAEQSASTLAIVELATGQIERIPISGMPNALAANGDRIYLTDTWHSSVQQLTARRSSVVDTDAANDPPVLTISQTRDYVYQASAVDPDDDTVTFAATQPFSGTVTDLGGGRFKYTPNSRADEGFVDHFAITADDGHGGIVTATVSAKVY